MIYLPTILGESMTEDNFEELDLDSELLEDLEEFDFDEEDLEDLEELLSDEDLDDEDLA